MKLSYLNYLNLVLLFLIGANYLFASSKVSIYVSAHQDDWQLFMGVNAYNDIANSSDSSRVVIIYVTAGDYSDCISASDSEAVPYFLAREQGAKNSVELAANSNKEQFKWSSDTVNINHHQLIRFKCRFVTSYFLRLADGSINGGRDISLKNFRKNRFTNNYSIDSLTSYTNWNDLSKTCESILLHEIKNTDEACLNLFDTNETINPDDHSDHYETGLLFMDLLKNRQVKRVFYEGYHSGKSCKSNLSNAEVMQESGLFAAYNQAMIDNHYPSIWNNDYLGFCDKNYFRIVSETEKPKTNRGKIAIAIFILFVLATSLTSYLLLKKKRLQISS